MRLHVLAMCCPLLPARCAEQAIPWLHRLTPPPLRPARLLPRRPRAQRAAAADGAGGRDSQAQGAARAGRRVSGDTLARPLAARRQALQHAAVPPAPLYSSFALPCLPASPCPAQCTMSQRLHSAYSVLLSTEGWQAVCAQARARRGRAVRASTHPLCVRGAISGKGIVGVWRRRRRGSGYSGVKSECVRGVHD